MNVESLLTTALKLSSVLRFSNPFFRSVEELREEGGKSAENCKLRFPFSSVLSGFGNVHC